MLKLKSDSGILDVPLRNPSQAVNDDQVCTQTLNSETPVTDEQTGFEICERSQDSDDDNCEPTEDQSDSDNGPAIQAENSAKNLIPDGNRQETKKTRRIRKNVSKNTSKNGYSPTDSGKSKT